MLISAIAGLVFTLSSCTKATHDAGEKPEPAEEDHRTESTLNVSGCSGWASPNYADLFVYECSGNRNMILHRHLECVNDSVHVLTSSPGRKTAVMVANCPMGFRMEALTKLESMELLTVRFEHDRPERPVMSAKTEFEPGESGILTLKPLMCRIILSEVSNGLPDYRLLEDPEIRLLGMNPYVRMLQEDEFRPRESEAGELVRLPHDIGFYTQYPGIALYCYPNDTPDNVLGTDRTRLQFSCTIDGKRYGYEHELPPFGRGSTLIAKVFADTEDTCLFSVNEIQSE